MTKDEKNKEIAALKDRIARANEIIVADHTGINVEDLTILRRKLRAAKSEFKVSKNTLLKIAAKDTGIEALEKHFTGPTAIIYGYDDPSVPAKIIYEAIKEKERPKFKAFYLEGNILGYEDLKKIAELPPRNVVIANLMGTIVGPIAQFVTLLNAASSEFIATLDALAESKKG